VGRVSPAYRPGTAHVRVLPVAPRKRAIWAELGPIWRAQPGSVARETTEAAPRGLRRCPGPVSWPRRPRKRLRLGGKPWACKPGARTSGARRGSRPRAWCSRASAATVHRLVRDQLARRLRGRLRLSSARLTGASHRRGGRAVAAVSSTHEPRSGDWRDPDRCPPSGHWPRATWPMPPRRADGRDQLPEYAQGAGDPPRQPN